MTGKTEQLHIVNPDKFSWNPGDIVVTDHGSPLPDEDQEQEEQEA